jgi:type VI protein secretion system component Hcp
MDRNSTDRQQPRELTEAELDCVYGGIVVTKLMDSTSPLLMQEALIGKGGKVSID